MKRFLIILGLAIMFFLFKTFYQLGQFKSITNYNSGKVIEDYTNMPGPEDMQVDYVSGNLFISADNRRQRGVDLPENGIYVLNLDEKSRPKKLETNYKGSFHPHGLSLLRRDSTLYVFVVNHNQEGDFVEVFEYINDMLSHIKSYSNELMCCPNDVVAVAKDKFYVTNDHGAKKGLMRILEDYFRIPRASLLYFNGSSFSTAMEPYLYANGVNVSNDGKYLYLTATMEFSVHMYAINEDGSLEFMSITDVETGVDNIDVDIDGNLWIGAHPKLFDFLKHAKDSTNLSPSHILKLSPIEDHHFTVADIYINDGSEISGSSVAVYYNNELFIGNVFDHKVLRIKLN